MNNKFLIWSNEHGAWWRPNMRGYTRTIGEAGRYAHDDAKLLCDEANKAVPAGYDPEEVMVLAP